MNSEQANNIWVALCGRWPILMQLDPAAAGEIIDSFLVQSGTPADKTRHQIPPSLDMVRRYLADILRSDLDPHKFMDFYESKGWKVGDQKMKDWQAACRRADREWDRRGRDSGPRQRSSGFA